MSELERAARRISAEAGHAMQCSFTGCTCGQAAKFADALIDLRSVLRSLNKRGGSAAEEQE